MSVKKEQRLCKSNDFQKLYQAGLRVRSKGIVLYAIKSSTEQSHIGIVASRKVGGAVLRNRFKRHIRVLFPLICAYTKQPRDFVVIASHPSVVVCDFFTLKSILLENLKKLSVLENVERV